jgi:hypothetical protein
MTFRIFRAAIVAVPSATGLLHVEERATPQRFALRQQHTVIRAADFFESFLTA